MKSKSAVNVVGTGRHGHWLMENAVLLPDVSFNRWSPSPGGEDHSIVLQQANTARISFASSWATLLSDPTSVILVLADTDRKQILEQGLRSGKTLVCVPPATCDEAQLHMIRNAIAEGGGRLLCSGWIGHTQAGAQATRLVRNDDFGKVHSMYLAIRTPRNRTSDVDVVEEIGWPAFDFVLSCMPGSLQSIYVCGGQLFNAGRIDTAICLIRFDSDAIATVELARCLPASFPTAPDGEIELEIIGANKTLRSEPNKSAVNIFGDDHAKSQPWTEVALAGMLNEATHCAAQNVADLSHLEKVVALVSMAQNSIKERRPIFAAT